MANDTKLDAFKHETAKESVEKHVTTEGAKSTTVKWIESLEKAAEEKKK